MASIGSLLAAGRKQPWEAGEGVVPDVPAQVPIDPRALAASGGAPAAPPQGATPSGDALALADILQTRQGAVAQAAAPNAQALQDVPLTWGSLLSFLSGLFAAKPKEKK